MIVNKVKDFGLKRNAEDYLECMMAIGKALDRIVRLHRGLRGGVVRAGKRSDEDFAARQNSPSTSRLSLLST